MIPSNTICPFADKCVIEDLDCPKKVKKDYDFSCPHARGYDIINQIGSIRKKLKVI